MAQIFGTITHASNISTNDHLMAVLENVDAFNSNELEIIRKKTAGKRYITLGIYLLLNQYMLFLDVEVRTYSLYQRPSLAVIVLHAGNLTDNGWYGKVYTSLFFVHPSILHFLF